MSHTRLSGLADDLEHLPSDRQRTRADVARNCWYFAVEAGRELLPLVEAGRLGSEELRADLVTARRSGHRADAVQNVVFLHVAGQLVPDFHRRCARVGLRRTYVDALRAMAGELAGARATEPGATRVLAREWRAPADHVGAKAICVHHDVPRSTLEAWEQAGKKAGELAAEEVVTDPASHEKHYPREWLNKRLQRWNRRGPRS